VASEDLRLDGVDVGINLLVAKIESGLQALEDVAKFSGLEPQVRRARDRSDAKARVQGNRHSGLFGMWRTTRSPWRTPRATKARDSCSAPVSRS
jgi:hypothetical protein